MRPQTFELSKKYVFSQITFFRKIRETNFHYDSNKNKHLLISLPCVELNSESKPKFILVWVWAWVRVHTRDQDPIYTFWGEKSVLNLISIILF
jgi:hypothetical protein